MIESKERVARRAEELFLERQAALHRTTDRLFLYLMLGQWLFGIFIALAFSPYGWAGKTKVVHAHVLVAVVLGGLITSLPVYLAIKRSGEQQTRLVIACAQMLWSALLIHLSGGRIETHFHVFGSLAFLAFYRDWRLLVPATIIVAADHLARQILWPESVYGVTNPESWRFLEHAFWVVFEDIVLIAACIAGVREMRDTARRHAEVEVLSEAMVRNERLAAVGQLAAGVGHELRNPLAAVQSASAFVAKRIRTGDGADPRVGQFLEVMDRELGVCTKIISDLLDFARERPIALAPCPLRALVDEAIRVLPEAKVKIVNAVPEDLPVPDLDREQFRQIVLNLMQNAVESIPADREGTVTVRAEGGGTKPWSVIVEDDGVGIAPDVAEKIFEPLFTTKSKGTGLGLAIVSNAVKRHNGSIRFDSRVGGGSTFSIDLPASTRRPVPATRAEVHAGGANAG